MFKTAPMDDSSLFNEILAFCERMMNPTVHVFEHFLIIWHGMKKELVHMRKEL